MFENYKYAVVGGGERVQAERAGVGGGGNYHNFRSGYIIDGHLFIGEGADDAKYVLNNMLKHVIIKSAVILAQCKVLKFEAS